MRRSERRRTFTARVGLQSVCRKGVLAGLTLVMIVCGAKGEDSTAKVLPDGVVQDVKTNNYGRKEVIIRLPVRPTIVEKGMQVGCFDLHEVFVDSSNIVLVAEATLAPIGVVKSVSGGMAIVESGNSGSQDSAAVKSGRPVLIRRRLDRGRQFVVLSDPSKSRLIYEQSFQETAALGTFWESLPGVARIEDGRLVADRYASEALRKAVDPNGGVLRIHLSSMGFASRYPFDCATVTAGALSIEFDIESSGGVLVRLNPGWSNKATLGVDYVVGEFKGMASGIHFGGRCQARVPCGSKRSHHVVLARTPESVSLDVDSANRTVRTGTNLLTGSFSCITIDAEKRFVIDNFRIWQLSSGSAYQGARVIGANPAGTSVVILRGESSDWPKSLDGRLISFDAKANVTSIVGAVRGEVGGFVICELKGATVGSIAVGCGIMLAGQSAAVTGPAMPSARNNSTGVLEMATRTNEHGGSKDHDRTVGVNRWQVSPSVLFDDLKTSSREVSVGCIGRPAVSGHRCSLAKVWVESDGNCRFEGLPAWSYAGPGFVHPIGKVLVHPATGERMGVSCERGVSCAFARNGELSMGRLGDPVPAVTNPTERSVFYALLSDRLLPEGAFCEITSSYAGCDFSSEKQTFWESVDGKWTVRNGRLESSAPDNQSVPMLVAARRLEGNFQFDMDVMVVKPVLQVSCQFTKDVSVLFYSPSTKQGLTFGFGVEGYGGVSSDRGAPGMVNVSAIKDYSRNDRFGYAGHGVFALSGLEAKVGVSYHLTVRRIDSQWFLYINGRRSLVDNDGRMSGEIQTWLLAPESVLSIDNTVLQVLPAGLNPPPVGTPLGELGYVVEVGQQDVCIDSCLGELRAGSKVSLMMVARATGGAAVGTSGSSSIKLTRAALGQVVATGRRLALVRLLGEGVQATTGCKVFCGELPKDLTVTADQLADIQYDFRSGRSEAKAQTGAHNR